MKIKCIIVEDEPLAQQVLERYINQTPELQLMAKCSNAVEAFDILLRDDIALIFLDIKMPSVSGIDFLKALKNPPAVIFTTAFSEYAVTSYELNAVDYLLKPITHARFKTAVDKLLKVKNELQAGKMNYLYIKITGRLVKVFYEDIVYAESMKDYIRVRTENENHVTHMTMKAFAGLLPADLFFRIHRSFIVSSLHITSISRNIIEAGNIKIPVGEHYKGTVDMLKNKIGGKVG